ncbi:MAG: hypothetical protein LAO05_18045 [Acidobacteriia bacterium]|nr:hypothetical protein [Terriglobia bacterium]
MRTAALSALLGLVAATAGAQAVQYTAPGSLAEEQIPTQERLKAAMDEARYHLGSLRFGPLLALKDVAWVNNVFGTETNQKSDFTATLAAGGDAYLPVGHRMTLGVYALPEYVWWRDLADRRGWNGAFGAGLFGYFNRMTVEIQACGERHQQYASSEIDVPVNQEDRRVSALVEVQVLGKVSLFARGGVDRWRYDPRGLPPETASQLTLLERDEKHAGGGVRFHFTEAISLGLGVEQYTTDFVHEEGGRSNSGPAPIAEVGVKTTHLRVVVNAIALDLNPTGRSEFIRYSGTAGDFQIGFRPTERLELEYYGGRSLSYSVQLSTPYFLDERTGVALQSPLGWRAASRIFWETGRRNYVTSAAGGSGGADHFSGYGGSFSLQIGRSASLNVWMSRSDITSAVATRNRSLTQIQASLQLKGGQAQWW